MIGFSCYIWNYGLVCELLREIPKVLPETDIWLGGPEVSFEAEKILARFPMVRGIMAGEGEGTFRDLLLWYVRRERPEEEIAGKCKYACVEEIPGLVLPEGATPVRNLLEIDKLPFPYEAASGWGKFDNRIIYYETSRGCPGPLREPDPVLRDQQRLSVPVQLLPLLHRQGREDTGHGPGRGGAAVFPG